MLIALTWIIDRDWGDAASVSPFFNRESPAMNPINTNNTSTTLSIFKSHPAIQDNKMSSVNRIAYLWGGHVLTGLGFIGMFLPLLPTTVFWIGAAICYTRSSPGLHKQLIEHKRFGKAIQDYLYHGVISYKGKWAAVISMSFSSALVWIAPLSPLLTLVGLFSIAIAMTYVVTRPGSALNA